MRADYFEYDGGAQVSYESPYVPPYAAPEPDVSDGQYFGLPPDPRDYGSYQAPPVNRGDEQYFGLPPLETARVSRVGPTASARYFAAVDPNIRAGSLLAGGLRGQSAFRPQRGSIFQRGFTVTLQEALRRRKRNRFVG